MSSLPPRSVGECYRSTRLRLAAVLGSLDRPAWDRPVAACPGWRVRDVLGHLVGNIEDASAGRISGPPSPDQTRQQVERHRTDDPTSLVARWAELAPGFEDALTTLGRWPAYIDALSHEHDVRAAVGDRSFRDHADVTLAAGLLTSALPAGLAIDLDGGTRDHSGGSAATLSASPFEVVRLRLGRRSTAQVLAMDWAGDPHPFLGDLFVFGPAAADLVE